MLKMELYGNFAATCKNPYRTALNANTRQQGGRKMLEENMMIQFLKKFDEYPFLVKASGKEYLIGEGSPLFTIK